MRRRQKFTCSRRAFDDDVMLGIPSAGEHKFSTHLLYSQFHAGLNLESAQLLVAGREKAAAFFDLVPVKGRAQLQ